MALGVMAVVLLGTTSPVQAQEVILGRWLTELRDGIIEITRAADDTFQGRIIGGNAPGRLDSHNPDPARRPQQLLGQMILQGLHQDGEESWSGGTIYDPNSGRMYKCRIQLLDRDHLKLRGFIGISLLGRTQSWSRYRGTVLVLPPAPP